MSAPSCSRHHDHNGGLVAAPVPQSLKWVAKHYPGFFLPAKTTTMEHKHAVVPWAAEFWCTVTSPAFSLPALLWLVMPVDAMPSMLHVTICLAILTSVVSTLYHATLWKILSFLDTSLAVVTFYSVTLNLIAVLDDVHPALAHPTTHLFVLAATMGLFVSRWPDTTQLSMNLFILVVPVAEYGLYRLGCYGTVVLSLVALSCFVVDRLKFLPGHTLWHLLGGLNLLALAFFSCGSTGAALPHLNM